MENGCQALREWKTQFSVENLEVEKMKSLTKLLLMNILPQHVASYYFERRLLGVRQSYYLFLLTRLMPQ